MWGLSVKTILNCFTLGLHPEIRRELAILNPYSISQVISLAKLIEDKIKDSKPKPFHSTTYPLCHFTNPQTIPPTQTNSDSSTTPTYHDPQLNNYKKGEHWGYAITVMRNSIQDTNAPTLDFCYSWITQIPLQNHLRTPLKQPTVRTLSIFISDHKPLTKTFHQKP